MLNTTLSPAALAGWARLNPHAARASRVLDAWTHLLDAESILINECPAVTDALYEVREQVRDTLRTLVRSAPKSTNERWAALELAIKTEGTGSVLASDAARAFVDANERDVAEAAAEA